MQLQYITS